MKKILSLSLLACLASCGPIYNTEYVYTPPGSSSGHACIAQCEIGRSQCIQIEQLKAERCQDRTQVDQDYCEDDIRYRKGRDPKWYECVPDSCDVDEERCENNYRHCYLSCGGKIDTVSRCVANCSNAPLPPQLK